MRLAAFCAQRPVFTVMVTLIAVVLGLTSLTRLPVDLLPDVAYPTLTVSTGYADASPREVEQQITRRVEDAVAAVPGVERINSVSGEGQSDVTLNFAWGTHLEQAANDLRDRLDRVVPSLPDEADRPRVRQVDLGDTPIMIIGVSGPLDPIELRRLVDDQMAYRLERLPGVGAIDIWGGLEREIEVGVDPGRLQSLGLTLDSVRDALVEADFEVAAGGLEEGRYDRALRIPGRFTDLDALQEITIARAEGAFVRLGQLAEIRDTHQRETRRIRINGEPGIRLAVRKQSEANTVATARELRRELARMDRDFPTVQVQPITDSARYIERAMRNLGQSIVLGGSLAILVLLFFLRDVRATAVAAVAIPISLVTSFALIYGGGFTLNLMTLGGLALGVGLMVDNAIVVLESVMARRERGAPPLEAAVQGTGEVAPAVIASTLTTLAIFLPLVFLEGLAGELFQPLAWVVAFSLFCSLLVALTLVPMLTALMPRRVGRHLARTHAGGAHRETGLERLLTGLDHGYRRVLAATLRNRSAALAIGAAAFVLAIALLPRLGTELMPATDEGDVRVTITYEPGTGLEFLDERVREIEARVLEWVPETEAWVSRAGSGGYHAGGGARGNLQLAVGSVTERDRSSEAIAQALRQALADIPGADVRIRARAGMLFRGGGFGGEGEQLAIEIRGFDLDTLDRLAEATIAHLEGVEGITDLRRSRDDGIPENRLIIDRTRAADLDVSPSQVARTLETAVAGTRAGLFQDNGEEVDIRVRLADARSLDLEDLLDLTVTNGKGEAIALRSLVNREAGTSPLRIDRRDRQRIALVYANIADRDLGSVVADVRERLAQQPLPRDYSYHLGGDYEEQEEAFSALTLTLVLAVVLVYMVMASLYESLRDPLVVMFTVPMAAIGVILALWLSGTTLNAQSFIGTILLAGIVVNNGILIVDRATRYRRAGLPPRAAALQAGRRRLRPVLMTSATTMLALLPLALGWGEGAEAQAPMARAVLGGLTSATLITLLLIPVVYTLFHPARKRAT
ncbi:efflux RND transporter permease subunit [Alkalilimnicola ehrlichii MLHE-1]|uniref:Acriflavin resistance protein n=1 Tax=Alkalilimnicola ehrlichii (strain ATCC BAA-1101 / DSM 17681 / MLHE-1) TaxID=187272 RepID=Q0AAY1_ALKEH|nr:efflux RND transporter permease subunit [Alkalilimnicola ehrlichii]ABI56006.1 acriflavin resistance protein [Alkalilimnicola ehrlichii MLHE-1]